MNGTLYPKLALTNIKKNARTYIPYIITCILTIAMYYIMKSLSMNDGLSGVQGGESVQEMLKFGNYVNVSSTEKISRVSIKSPLAY